jgi:hypothetical protein
LFRRATGYSHPETKVFCGEWGERQVKVTKHYPPDTAACFIWLKNRRPEKWRDVQKLEHSGVNGGPIETRTFSSDEIQKALADFVDGVEDADKFK